MNASRLLSWDPDSKMQKQMQKLPATPYIYIVILSFFPSFSRLTPAYAKWMCSLLNA